MVKKDSRSIELLLVEDDEDFCRALTLRLVKRGFKVTMAASAEEAMDKFGNSGFDVIVADIKLPGMDGIEFLAQVREVNKELPVILITGYASLESAKEAVKLNAVDYLLKPLGNINDLLNPINKAVHGYRLLLENKRLTGNLRIKVNELEKTNMELKNAQQQLLQSSKMAAMGQLAAGISHELNQPLTGIKGFAQAAFLDLDGDTPLKGDLTKIIEQADRMDQIIKNVRLFARKSEFKIEELDINKPLEASLMLLGKQLKVHDIRISTSLDRSLPRTKGDMNQLQQVFLNLISNARDAIDSLQSPEDSELSIKTCLCQGRKNIEVTFKDSGCGIAEENLEHIFNPFFTTKSFNGSMGLGLSIAHSIIEDHNGRIEVESAGGKGTTFKVILPVA